MQRPETRLDARGHLRPFTDPKVLAERGPRVIVRGEGVFIEDDRGRRFLDGMAGLWCVQVGYGRRALIEAGASQLERLPYYNTFFGTTSEPVLALVERLTRHAPPGLDRFVFANSGSEAVDAAVRLIRHAFACSGRPEKRVIIGREYGYHGSTMAAASVGGMAKMHAQGGLPLPGFEHVMPPYAFEFCGDHESEAEFAKRAVAALDERIESIGADRVAAFIGEPVMGAGGVITPPVGYWEGVQAVCRSRDVLLVADEVICGFGRTGAYWGSDRYGIAPDAITMAKGITSGYLPLSALALGPRIADVLEDAGVLQHGFTYSGHPTAAAVAVANLDLIDAEALPERAAGAIGERFRVGLDALAARLDCIGEARSVGLIGALELVAPGRGGRVRIDPPGFAAARVAELCLDAGLVVRAIRECVALCPPLSISPAEVDLLLERLGEALARFERELAR